MFILDGCGWIPNATINFIANIVDIIKIFVPILLIIMGAIEFGKAVMAQQEDQIKKSQTAFIQKIIAGAAVFFVIVLVGWLLKVINNADSSLNANDALNCMSLMFNGGYNAEIIDPMEPPSLNKSTTNKTNSNNNNNSTYLDSCLKSCPTYEYAKNLLEEAESAATNLPKWLLPDILNAHTADQVVENCKARCRASDSLVTQLQAENVERANCMAANSCTDINNCPTCGNSVDKYNRCVKYSNNNATYSCSEYSYLDVGEESFMESCKAGTLPDVNINKSLKLNHCYTMWSNTTSTLEKCCKENYNSRLSDKNECASNFLNNNCSQYETDLVKWYCSEFPNECLNRTQFDVSDKYVSNNVQNISNILQKVGRI